MIRQNVILLIKYQVREKISLLTLLFVRHPYQGIVKWEFCLMKMNEQKKYFADQYLTPTAAAAALLVNGTADW